MYVNVTYFSGTSLKHFVFLLFQSTNIVYGCRTFGNNMTYVWCEPNATDKTVKIHSLLVMPRDDIHISDKPCFLWVKMQCIDWKCLYFLNFQNPFSSWLRSFMCFLNMRHGVSPDATRIQDHWRRDIVVINFPIPSVEHQTSDSNKFMTRH